MRTLIIFFFIAVCFASCSKENLTGCKYKIDGTVFNELTGEKVPNTDFVVVLTEHNKSVFTESWPSQWLDATTDEGGEFSVSTRMNVIEWREIESGSKTYEISSYEFSDPENPSCEENSVLVFVHEYAHVNLVIEDNPEISATSVTCRVDLDNVSVIDERVVNLKMGETHRMPVLEEVPQQITLRYFDHKSFIKEDTINMLVGHGEVQTINIGI